MLNKIFFERKGFKKGNGDKQQSKTTTSATTKLSKQY
jgi:hypothetical protein